MCSDQPERPKNHIMMEEDTSTLLPQKARIVIVESEKMKNCCVSDVVFVFRRTTTNRTPDNQILLYYGLAVEQVYWH